MRVNDTLLLDAGNTLIYLDHDAVAELTGLDASALRSAEGAAKRAYEATLRSGTSHEDGWLLFMQELLARSGAREGLTEQVRMLRAEHDRRNLWRKVPPGLREVLTEARDRGWKLGVVSNSEGRLVEILTEVGIAEFFGVIVDSAVVGVAKPDPRIFALALDALGSSAQKAIYAGDVPDVDVAGARAAGIEAVLVDSLDHYPDYTEAPRFQRTADLVRALLSGAEIR